jgi:hypothetical protein
VSDFNSNTFDARKKWHRINNASSNDAFGVAAKLPASIHWKEIFLNQQQGRLLHIREID